MHDREHMVLLEPRGAGIVATVLRWPYEMRSEDQIFGAIPLNKTVEQDLLDVAGDIVARRMGHFDPKQFEDRYEEALTDLIRAKQAGRKPKPVKEPTTTVPTSIFDALKASLRELDRSPGPARRAKASPAAWPAPRSTAASRKTARR
jgi:DNA end-binding protein Ku